MKDQLKKKVNQNTNLHNFGFKNIKVTIKDIDNINHQHKLFQQTIKFKPNL